MVGKATAPPLRKSTAICAHAGRATPKRMMAMRIFIGESSRLVLSNHCSFTDRKLFSEITCTGRRVGPAWQAPKRTRSGGFHVTTGRLRSALQGLASAPTSNPAVDSWSKQRDKLGEKMTGQDLR